MSAGFLVARVCFLRHFAERKATLNDGSILQRERFEDNRQVQD